MKKGIVKIVANVVTDGVILIKDDGSVVPYGLFAFSPSGCLQKIKEEFTSEAEGGGIFGIATSYVACKGEIEHPEAVVIFTEADGWLI